MKIKAPFLYNLQEKTDIRLISSLVKRLHSKLDELMCQFSHILEMLAKVQPFKGTTLVDEKAKLCRNNFGIFYWHNRLINLFFYVCSESTHEEKFIQSQLLKEKEVMEDLKERYVEEDQENKSKGLF